MGSPILWGGNSTASNLQTRIIQSNGSLLSDNGAKNYLSLGNFENGATTGWSLGTVGSLTNGIPTGSPTFGSGASGNLSIAVVSSGQIAGNSSLSLVSSAATTQGDMLASQAYSIDASDQAKVLTFQFYYKLNSFSGTQPNFSGTSSNSWGVAVYDVTNSSWLTLAGNFAMTQSSGVGYATGTCQTNATTASVRFVLYNANATNNAATLYLDRFFLGPQTAPYGPVVTDWTTFTMTIGGTSSAPTKGSVLIDLAKWRRVGDSMEIEYNYSQNGVGSGGSGGYLFPIPGGVTIDTTRLGTSTSTAKSVCGYGAVFDTDNLAANADRLLVTAYNSTNLILSGYDTATAGSNIGSGFFSIGSANRGYSFSAKVPIAGWSSNVQMSNDTDTRVQNLIYTNNAGTSLTASVTNIDFSTQVVDTHGAWSGTVFTAPITGQYALSGSASFTAPTGLTIFAYVNGSKSYALCQQSITANIYSLVGKFSLKAGDTLSVRSDTSATLSNTNGSFNHWISINRLSGPAVIAATETVAASYYQSADNNPGANTQINFDTKLFDTHNAVTTGSGAWKFTSPVSGYYIVSGAVSSGGANYNIRIYKNGSAYALVGSNLGTSATYNFALSNVIISLNGGDTLDLRPDGGGTVHGTGAPYNTYITIGRMK